MLPIIRSQHPIPGPGGHANFNRLTSLELATAEGRILVTANIKDFEPLLREWAGESRPHTGVILVPSSVRNEAFGVLILGVEETLADTGQEERADRVAWLRKV